MCSIVAQGNFGFKRKTGLILKETKNLKLRHKGGGGWAGRDTHPPLKREKKD